MFDGLDDIKWEDFGETHIAIGVKTYEIPDLIRDMLHDDPEQREWAIAYLLGEGQHLGMLDKPTPYIIPFVLEVLEKHPTYDQRGYLMLGISLMFDQMFNWSNFEYMRLAIAVYDAIKPGYEIYKRLLNDPETEVRLYSAQVLSWMQDHTIDALSALTARLKLELDAEVRQEVIKGIIKLISLDGKIYLWSPEGKAIIQDMYEYLKDKGAFEEKVVFSRELERHYFRYDDDIEMFMQRIKARAKLTGKWDDDD